MKNTKFPFWKDRLSAAYAALVFGMTAFAAPSSRGRHAAESEKRQYGIMRSIRLRRMIPLIP